MICLWMALAITQGIARTEGRVQSARPVGAVRALPGHRDRAKEEGHTR